jgi:ribosome biogenesis GTPase / thiamine phosphate phosphatase
MDLDRLGWRGGPEVLEALSARGESVGRVAIEHRGGYLLYTEAGEVTAEVSGRFRHEARLGTTPGLPAVGDWVAIRPRPGEDRATIRAILPRRTVFARKVAGREVEAQVIAANVDVVFLVSALDGDLNPRRIERYLGLVWGSGATPVVVLNKADLCPDIPPAVDRVAAVAPGVAIHVVSALSGSGLEALGDAFLDSRTVALLGSSGVGKSSLINLLVGREAQRVHDVRADGKGRHTTTRRELIPRPEGGLVIDTPGMRELQLWEGGEGVPAAFAEVEDFAARCRFTDCSHDAEPGCAVLDAVADGTLAPERLASYRKLRGEVRHLEARQDQRARDDLKRRDKVLNRALYKRLDQKRRW